MKYILSGLFIALLSACSMLPPVDTPSSIRSTVRLIAEDGPGNGSAIVLKPGLLLTAGHVADEITNGRVLYIEPQHIKATVLRKSKKHDLALLEAPGVVCPCAVLADTEPKVNDPLTIIGFPMNFMVETQIMTYGHLQGISEGKFTHTVHAAPGNSGGGVFYEDKLVGVLVEGWMDFNYLTRSVRLKVIQEFLNG